MPEQEEFEIDDPEELSQKKRIKELLNRRSGVIDKRSQAKEAMVAGEISRMQALQIYQSGIEALIMDLWTKFMNEDAEGGKELLKTEQITTVKVHPPDELLPDTKSDFAAGEDYPEPEKVPINGLEWFIDNEPVVERTFTAYTWNPPGEQTVVGRRLVDFDIMDKAVQKIVEFIDATGIDADMKQEEQQTKIDRELLEEVDEWRKQNVE